MEPGAYLDCLRADGTRLREAAAQGLDLPIPTCPDWDMAALVTHVGRGHRWFGHIVEARSAEDPRDFPTGPADPEVLLSWYDEGLTKLIAALTEISPDEPVWNWFENKPAPARFWHRRASLETAVHRWDAEVAAGRPEPIDRELAVDGIDEHLAFMSFFFRNGLKHVADLSGSLHLHATGTEGEWHVELAPDRVDFVRAHSKADAAIRGPASTLLLWLVNRCSADSKDLQLFGDRAILESWQSVRF